MGNGTKIWKIGTWDKKKEDVVKSQGKDRENHSDTEEKEK